MYLLTQDDQIRWNKDLPIKVNIHSWHLKFDRLPTRFNLDIRDIDLHSTRCPVCDGAIETAQHLFVECEVASNLWNSIKGWWHLNHCPNNLTTRVLG